MTLTLLAPGTYTVVLSDGQYIANAVFDNGTLGEYMRNLGDLNHSFHRLAVSGFGYRLWPTILPRRDLYLRQQQHVGAGQFFGQPVWLFAVELECRTGEGGPRPHGWD